MDLDLDNYNLTELLNIFEITKNDLNADNLQKIVNNKIQQIKSSDDSELPESKIDLIDFYYKISIKLLNEIDKSEILNEKKIHEKLQKNQLYQQDSHFVIEKQSDEDKKILNQEQGQYYKQEYYKQDSQLINYNINPFKREFSTKIININTKFRSNYNQTSPTDFDLELPVTVKKVVAMKLLDIKLLDTVYSFNNKLGSTYFYLNGIKIDISNGNQSVKNLINEINTNISLLTTTDVELSFNLVNSKMTFFSPSTTNFSLDFEYRNDVDCYNIPQNVSKNQLTLGWILGFRGNYVKQKFGSKTFTLNNKYSQDSSYTAEALFDEYPNHYFLLAINDFQNNHDSTFISPFQNQTMSEPNILAKIHSYNITTPFSIEPIINPIRRYFGPTDIRKIHVTLYDEVGRILDTNNNDFSFTLETQILYDY
tara:strand:- start:649 stop:1920 length:1272 start_codon:yes stop_codon:yes gene_type:complete